MEGFGRIDNISVHSLEKDQLISSLHQTFEKQKQIYQPKPESFIGMQGFDEPEIKKELALVKTLKEKWQTNNGEKESNQKKISDVFEGIIVDQFCGEWMAGKAEAFFTAEPDDLIRKVDCVVEFKPDETLENPEYLGVGIDVTFSSDYSTVDAKLSDIWEKDIERSRKVVVKYVDTESFKGSLEVCRAVLVADKETVQELARLYKHKNKEGASIDEHPFLANILSQLKYQLESYYHYAQQHGAKGDYLRHVTKTLSTFYRIYSEKEEFIKQHYQEVISSGSFKTIQEFCDEKLNVKKG